MTTSTAPHLSNPATQPIQPQLARPTQEDPNLTLAIVGVCLVTIPIPIAPLIICTIALNNSKKRGYKNTLAFVGLIMSIISTVFIAGFLALLVTGALNDGSIRYDTPNGQSYFEST